MLTGIETDGLLSLRINITPTADEYILLCEIKSNDLDSP